jgi:hypothetical protein
MSESTISRPFSTAGARPSGTGSAPRETAAAGIFAAFASGLRRIRPWRVVAPEDYPAAFGATDRELSQLARLVDEWEGVYQARAEALRRVNRV